MKTDELEALKRYAKELLSLDREAIKDMLKAKTLIEVSDDE